MGIRCAVIVGVPIPEQNEIDASGAIDQAVHEAAEQGIKSQALTPFLLNRVGKLTGGKSLDANIALLRNSARVAGETAAALSRESGGRIGFVV